jgi:outer membrane protein assembly factor BamE
MAMWLKLFSRKRSDTMTMRNTTRLILTLFCLLALSACVYRANISQGNLIKQEDLDQAAVGMTKSQIRFLLGTPMIDDPFTRNRWDYVYYLKVGRRDTVQKRWVSVYFVDEKVSEIRKDLELAPDL